MWKWYWEAKRAKAGELQAELEYAKRTPLSLQLRMKIMELLDRVDPIEAAAVACTTVVIHDVILTTSEFLEKVNNVGKGLAQISGTPEELNFITSMPVVGWLANFPWLAGELVSMLLEGEKAVSDEDKKRMISGASKLFEDTRRDTWFLWFISFGIAFYVIRNGLPDIFGAIQGFLGMKPG